MAIRNDLLGGSDFTSEYLASSDLNDTFNASVALNTSISLERYNITSSVNNNQTSYTTVKTINFTSGSLNKSVYSFSCHLMYGAITAGTAYIRCKVTDEDDNVSYTTEDSVGSATQYKYYLETYSSTGKKIKSIEIQLYISTSGGNYYLWMSQIDSSRYSVYASCIDYLSIGAY